MSTEHEFHRREDAPRLPLIEELHRAKRDRERLEVELREAREEANRLRHGDLAALAAAEEERTRLVQHISEGASLYGAHVDELVAEQERLCKAGDKLAGIAAIFTNVAGREAAEEAIAEWKALRGPGTPERTAAERIAAGEVPPGHGSGSWGTAG